MFDSLVLTFRWNAGVIKLGHFDRGECARVVCNDGEFRVVRWLGFISIEQARQLKETSNAKGVRLLAYRLGYTDGFHTNWFKTFEPYEEFMLGCEISSGVYGIIEFDAKLIRKT